jgi:hypothetical protein
MDWPESWHGNKEPIHSGMVLIVHTPVVIEEGQLTQVPRQTCDVIEGDPEPLSHMPPVLVANP